MTLPKILIIDDEPVLQMALERALKYENYNIVFASNGLEGIEKLQTEKPDLVLLDLRMPKLDGFAFLKKSILNLMIPIVLLSSPVTEMTRKSRKALSSESTFFCINQ